MEPTLEASARGAPQATFAPDLQCRVCELEEENIRLRLLVSELLVANQQLREQGHGRQSAKGHRD
jgi:hypothetical protein